MANLIQKSDCWIVAYMNNNEVVNEKFTTIELAADFLENKLGIYDEHIDHALCEMAAYGHSRAVFGNKRYSHSEEK